MKKTVISILTLSIVGIAVSSTIISNNGNNSVSALTYSDNVGLNFTFSPSLSVSLSSTSGSSNADLVINDLTPGTSSDSNAITVTVLSNNRAGYVLGATVGDNQEANPNGAIYNTDALIHSSYTSADNTNIAAGTFEKPIFANITADIASLTVDNTWGYSYSLDGGTTWINQSGTTNGYSGLPLYTDTPAELKTATGPSPAAGDNVGFKTAAKASTTQASGEYNNVINFIATANVDNQKSFYEAFSDAGKTMVSGYYKMQDMNDNICSAVTVPESATYDNETMQAQLIDTRDDNVYWVAKLRDGHCWMTQNLDLNLSTGATLTSNDTDLIDGSLTGAYAEGYTNTGGVISWTSATDTVEAITTETTSIDSFNWTDSRHTPISVDPGNWYWKGTYYDPSTYCPVLSTTNPAYIGCDYISKRTEDKSGTAVTNNWATYFSTSESISAYGTHDHVGNYYNWPMAIASNSSSSLQTGTDTEATVGNSPQNSICPKGWRLPTVTTDYATGGTTGHNDFYNLNYACNGGKANTDAGLIGAPAYFVRGGNAWTSYLHRAGYNGTYWSSSVSSSTSTAQARYLSFSSGWVNPQNSSNRHDGLSVRCVAR